MKKILTAIIVLLGAVQIKAQILQPVHWSYAAKKTSPTEAVVFIKANIDEGWHVYSQYVKDGGPVKTTITFSPDKTYALIDKTIEPKPITRMEKVFSMEVGFFEKSVIFQQKIKLKTKQTTVNGKLEYMTCNDKQCLPPEDIDFSIPVK
ncbi:thiol:disulfide interchange protein DsbD [Mucilaginibacter lappiensis]|uniref:Thiol:disulfide interchange protein DsbD n=1 Tax=Mucilaginibacter lappiensis TaxID=354630 RepID=A0ABR6PCY9_9SPHI|nr:protein-disulfide reductase DsbD domain-containing protein [Mucilaginibacter lappiensis]MBB6107614.1 thiol:disulfide interchange protein DsbD [Mucilaginibacter lappiensis]SIQ02802.1 thiol:disulfide interchange protein DsbD [Mucilaginibacter lappiensis]